MIKPTLDFSTTSVERFEQANLAGADILFIGAAVDTRGKEAIEKLTNFSSQTVKLGYAADRNSILIDDNSGQFGALVDICRDKSIRIETTTLGLAEIIKVTQACRQAGLNRMEFVYVEPKEYSLRKPVAEGYFDPRDFELTKNRTFSAVHGFAYEYSPHTKEKDKMFLGMW